MKGVSVAICTLLTFNVISGTQYQRYQMYERYQCDSNLSVALGVEHNLWRPIPPGGNILCQEPRVVVVRILRSANPVSSLRNKLTATLARPKSHIFRSQVVFSNKLLGFKSLQKVFSNDEIDKGVSEHQEI